MLECKMTRSACRLWERQGAKTYSLQGGKTSKRAWPDRLVVAPPLHAPPLGLTMYLEAKRGYNRAREDQRQVLQDLRDRGQCAYVLHLWGDETLVVGDVDGTELTGRVAWNQMMRTVSELHTQRLSAFLTKGSR